VNYTVLVIGEELAGRAAQCGDLVAAKPAGAAWGESEASPRFERIEIDATAAEIECLLANYRYSFERSRFEHRQTQEPFDPADVVLPSHDYSGGPEKNREVVEQLSGGSFTGEPSGYLRPSHLEGDERDLRRYFLAAVFPYRNQHAKVRELLEAVKYGCYGHIWGVLQEIPQEVLQQLDLTEADRQWLQDIWQVG
jgi:hypothetical protein